MLTSIYSEGLQYTRLHANKNGRRYVQNGWHSPVTYRAQPIKKTLKARAHAHMADNCCVRGWPLLRDWPLLRGWPLLWGWPLLRSWPSLQADHLCVADNCCGADHCWEWLTIAAGLTIAGGLTISERTDPPQSCWSTWSLGKIAVGTHQYCATVVFLIIILVHTIIKGCSFNFGHDTYS